MKIAYVTTYDSSNEHAWSGSGYYMYESMIRSGCEAERIGDLKIPMNAFFKLKKFLYKVLRSENYQKQREPAILRSYGVQLQKRLKSLRYDAILSPGSLPLTYLTDDRPKIFWTDATFASLVDFFPDFSNIPKSCLRRGNEMEQRALDNCSLAIYTSQWAADSAIRHYGADPEKIKVVPFGANIQRDATEQDIHRIVDEKQFKTCKLLFMGVDWLRKGGDTAVRTAEWLNKNGVETELHVVGTKAPYSLPFIIQHGFISKNTAEGNAHMKTLFEQSHFMILPSIADCVPVVIAEACSYGLPVVSTNVGGITSAIINDVNGRTFPLSDGPEKYAEYIATRFTDIAGYKKLMLQTFHEYQRVMNWENAGKKVKALIESLLT